MHVDKLNTFGTHLLEYHFDKYFICRKDGHGEHSRNHTTSLYALSTTKWYVIFTFLRLIGTPDSADIVLNVHLFLIAFDFHRSMSYYLL